MRQTFLLSSIFAALLPLAVHANDLSLAPTSLQLKLATLDSAQSFNPGDAEAGPQLIVEEDSALPPVDEQVDVWGRLRQGFAIPDLEDPLVKNHINWYASRPEYMERTTKRASRYLYFVLQELEKRNMPTELALLPFIESAFNPHAFSSASAAGMWQFIPSTGRDYNLKQTMFKDERRAVLASTDAALTYLQRLHDMFGDWQLALAAYNWGEGNVQKLVRRNQSLGRATDFATLSSMMPPETRNYVPKLQAVKNLVANPEQYAISLPKIENQPYFITVSKNRDMDVKIAAQLAEMPMEEFTALNPQFNRPVILGNAKTDLLLPQENANKFKANLKQWGSALSSWTTHTITSAREKIETLAAKFSTTPEVIRAANNIPPKMRLRAGSTILVPKSDDGTNDNISIEVADNAKMLIEPDVADTRKLMLRVGKRDSLHSIAQRYKVSVADIKSWNGLQRDQVSNGQRLQLHLPILRSKHRSPQLRHAVARKRAPVFASKVNRNGKRT